MGDADNTLPSIKKRTAERQITKENFGLDDDEDTSGQDSGTFQRASDDVLAQRKIVKVRRPSVAPPSASNPFAGIRLVPPTNLSATPVVVTPADESDKSVSDDIGKKDGVNQETKKGKDDTDKNSESKVEEAGTESTVEDDKTKTEEKDEDDKKVQSSAGEAGTKSTFEDGRTKTEGKVEDYKKMQSSAGEPETESMVSKGKDNTVTETTKLESTDEKAEEVDESKNEAETDAIDNKSENEEKIIGEGEGVDVQKDGATPFSSFQQLSSSQNAFTGVAGSGFLSSTFSFGSISKDGSTVDSGFSKSTFFSSLHSSVANRGSGFMQEVTVETGEENEKAVFTAYSVLFEFLDGGWKERGKGEIRVNVSSVGTGKARLVMRARGNYRLILNASLYPGMKLTAMEKKGVTFACMNSNDEGKKDELSTFALKFKDASIVEEFRAVVTEHTCKTTTGLRTPENSPEYTK